MSPDERLQLLRIVTKLEDIALTARRGQDLGLETIVRGVIAETQALMDGRK